MLRNIRVFTSEGNAKLAFTVSTETLWLWSRFLRPLQSRRTYWHVRRQFHYVYGSGLPGDKPTGKAKCGWPNFRDGVAVPRNSYFVLPNGDRVTLWELGANYVLDNAPEEGRLLTHLRYHQGPWIIPASEKEWFARCLKAGSSWYVRTDESIAKIASLALQTANDILIVPGVGPEYCRGLHCLPAAEGVSTPEQERARLNDDTVQDEWAYLPPSEMHQLMVAAARSVSEGWHPLCELTAATVREKRYTEYSLEQVLHDIRQR